MAPLLCRRILDLVAAWHPGGSVHIDCDTILSFAADQDQTSLYFSSVAWAASGELSLSKVDVARRSVSSFSLCTSNLRKWSIPPLAIDSRDNVLNSISNLPSN